ncbi:MAG: aminopeptidase P family N-terminal domain-containing protein, partial [Chloroflexi bacterium]|nr:aminopeptidase P family N-terminal domain-containing protein [Chloroflexota bacterium]
MPPVLLASCPPYLLSPLPPVLPPESSSILTSLHITPAEFNARAERLRQHLQAEGLSGAVLFERHYILYYTGFAFIPTERPIAFVINAAGEKALFVPRLELEHAKANAQVDRVDHYLEYPYTPHPMETLKATLADMGIRERIGADTDGYPWILGYRGPALSELAGAKVQPVAGSVEDQMMIKSQGELALIRE